MPNVSPAAEPVGATPAAASSWRRPLVLGSLTVDPPVVLAPMAGVTNVAYRTLCREQALAGLGGGAADVASDSLAGPTDDLPPVGAGRETRRPSPNAEAATPGTLSAGLYTCEMITARGITERIPKTFDMLRFGEGETRSVQLYGTDAAVLAEATRVVCGEFGVQHVDLNFGCPVPKVTRRGGGGALPWKLDRLEAILRQTVQAAEPFGVPVTIKTRVGIDDDHLTYRDAGRLAEQAGCAAVTLHARTVLQAYGGQAAWDRIADLVSLVSIPVIGNGDIWEAADAWRMMRQTGCAGVMIGRGCLGRPWLFRDLAEMLRGRDLAEMLRGRDLADTFEARDVADTFEAPDLADTSVGATARALPTLGEVAAMVRRHAELLAGLRDEPHGLADLRKHMGWYFKGFPVGGDLRGALARVSSLAELDELLARLDPDAPFPVAELGSPRGRQGNPRARVVLPYGWFDSRALGDAVIVDEGGDASGG